MVDPAAAEDKPKWEFEFESYGWATGNYGSVTVKGHSAKVDVSPIDLYQLMEDGNAFGGDPSLVLHQKPRQPGVIRACPNPPTIRSR